MFSSEIQYSREVVLKPTPAVIIPPSHTAPEDVPRVGKIKWVFSQSYNLTRLVNCVTPSLDTGLMLRHLFSAKDTQIQLIQSSYLNR